MRTLLGLLFAPALLWLTSVVFAGNSGNSSESVTVPLLDLLAITNGGTITLDSSIANPAGSAVLGPVNDSTARLNYTQNSTGLKKITAQATTAPTGNDITLTVAVAGGAGTKTLVSNGTAQASQDVYTGIAAGAFSNRTVTYGARCTVTGTKVSASTNFVYTVTFTSVSS
ncbi:MAG: hypothetical protein NTX64_01095 [Elusimicrobia bacterium]|nr:hypothetical protein [Elusimicrobiota bacterium]